MKKLLFLFLILGIFLALPPMALAGYVGLEVWGGSYEAFDRNKIVDLLSKESIVYFADGQNQVGSIFGTEHRKYLTIQEIPKVMQDALVAAEDENFNSHHGVDLVATGRAAFRNVFLGKREGASTITQQTVKNLFGRKKTNIYTKFQEMINAFKLERKFSKPEILEFYLNQFHVTGNGRGIGVAAKYYFNKEAEELNLTEAAFIAGSVKGPEKYVPFNKKTPESQDKARAEAKFRKNYVLKRMLETHTITAEQFDKAKDEEVPFAQGRFQFNNLSIMEVVQRQLSRPEVLQAVGADSLEQMSGMGLRVTTFLNFNIQNAAQYAVRQNLSRIEMILSDFEKEPAVNFVNIQKPEKMGFYTAKIKAIDLTPKAENLTLSFGVPECLVPTEAIDRVARITDQARFRGFDKSKAEFLKSLKLDEFVLASVKEITLEGKILCDLERRPRVQGGLIAMDKGRVIAMVGGYNPHEYNRAVFAKRQPGSAFKTLTYYPALQMGWSILDSLENFRNLFVWQGQNYFPRPDHKPESLEVNFIGAGSKSENLASVWLMAHLTDRLRPEQFKDLLVQLKLYSEGEPQEAFLARIGRQFNVVPTENQIRSGVFHDLQDDWQKDLTISRDKLARFTLAGMHYGLDFDDDGKVEEALEASKKVTKYQVSAGEKNLRLNVFRNNFTRWKRLSGEAASALEVIKNAHKNGDILTREERQRMEHFRVTTSGKLAWVASPAYSPNAISPLVDNPTYKNLSPEEVVHAIEEQAEFHDEGGILLDGVLPLYKVSEMQKDLDEKYAEVSNGTLMQKLYYHRDFKYSLGMYYASKMVKEMGIESEVQWVPAYPLGVNVVTLAELALAYQTILTGKTWRYFETTQENQMTLIRRIEDSKGNLLWEASPKEWQLLDPQLTPSMLSVMRATVTNGTAYAAHNNVVLRSKDTAEDDALQKALIRVPIFGKTGTTNDYTNATFAGFLPYPPAEGTGELSPENAYTIASYVGYDSNEQMKRNSFKIQGASGGLPAWVETALAIIREENFAGKINWKAMADAKQHEVPFDYGKDLTRARSSMVDDQPASTDDDGEGDVKKTNLNDRLNDYEASGKKLVNIHVQGQYVNNVFSPTRRVSWFKARPRTVPAKNAGAPTTEGTPVGDAPSFVPTLAPESPLEEDDAIREQDLPIPPPPQNLGDEGKKTTH